MLCESPIQLKSGIVVPCGKCLLCLSHRRDEWSVRLQLHSIKYDKKPFFITFTYDSAHLTYGADEPTLVKKDFQLFVKRLKDKFDLYNTDFAFFAAGEYGDSLERPHFHAIMFGLDFLYPIFDCSWKKANDVIKDVWQNGFVYVGIAETSGIHYTSKYVLKYANGNFDGVQKPFILASHGIGLPWLDSPEGRYFRSRLDLFKLRAVQVPYLDTSSFDALRSSAYDGVKEMERYYPKFQCTLDSGFKAPLPSYLKRKLIGSFECFTDNPFWLFESFKNIVNSCDYVSKYADLDCQTIRCHQQQVVNFAIRKIKNRLIQSGKL